MGFISGTVCICVGIYRSNICFLLNQNWFYYIHFGHSVVFFCNFEILDIKVFCHINYIAAKNVFFALKQGLAIKQILIEK